MEDDAFRGPELVSFGSANYTPFELAPASTTDFKDETVLMTQDPSIFNAFLTKFDVMWNDTAPEPDSQVPSAPYFKSWDDACANEFTGKCNDYPAYVTAPTSPPHFPMVVNTDRLVLPGFPTDLPDMVWGQGSQCVGSGCQSFNDRLIQEITVENTRVDFVIYRLTVENITTALLNKFKSGVPIRIIDEPNEYLNRAWPEFWLTHANIDKLWAAGVPMKMRVHNGLTHMKMLVTSSYATNASNYA